MPEYDIVPYVRQVCDLEEDEISDVRLAQLASIGWRDLQSRIGVKEVLEEVSYIDVYRKNRKDGSNKEFYVMNSFHRYMGDLNYDLELDEDDIEVWKTVSNVEGKTQLTVTDVTGDGKFTLDVAPDASDKLFTTYIHLPLSFSPMSPMVIDALAYITAAMSYGKLEARDYERIGFRGLNIVRMPHGYSNFYMKYQDAVRGILTQDKHSFIKRTQDIDREYESPVIPPYIRRKY